MGNTKTFQEGKYIFRIGEPGGSLIVIKKGKVLLLKHNSKGEEIEISTIGPGDLIGSMTILSGSPRNSSCKGNRGCRS